ncbi:MAG: DUF6457 domain-containing protein [Candidatus Dormibacteraeota bacterium]|nr:DUF6457 domain-containing protein [Candidatus Dormibacteraeota bacterium]
MNPFFDDLGERWVASAMARGVEIARPEMDSQVALELLELARVAAHTQERRFAPLACYLAGVAAERLRSGRPDLSAAEVADYVNEVRQSLESRPAPE